MLLNAKRYSCPPKFDENHITEDITYLSHRTWENNAGTDVKASVLLDSFHSAKVSYRLPEEKSNHQSYLSVNSEN